MKPTDAAKKIRGRKKRATESLPALAKRPEERSLSEELELRQAGLTRWASEEPKMEPDENNPNPLLRMEEADRAKLYAWLRECPYHDAVQHVLKDQGIGEVSPEQMMEFFQTEAAAHWETRISRAAVEANALVLLAEKSPVKFSSGILAALGQEAFRQIASGEVEPESMVKITNLFLKARSDERSDRMQELRREKLKRELQGQINHALEKLSEEVEKHPEARAAFEALQIELEKGAESLEEET